MRVVPQPDGRFAEIVFVAQNAEARGAEQEITPASRFEAEPACSEHAHEMRARKQQDVPVDGGRAADDAVGSCAYLNGRLPAWAAIAKQLPIRALQEDLGSAAALILGVAPFYAVPD